MSIQHPLGSVRLTGLNHAQLLNAGGRIVDAALADEGKGGLPADATESRRVTQDLASSLHLLRARIRLESKGLFTKEKLKYDRLRDSYVAAIRRGLKTTSADPLLPPAKKDAADLLAALLAKRPKRFEFSSQAENSTELDLLIADYDQPASISALQVTGLDAHYAALKEAHHAFLEFVRKSQLADAGLEQTGPAKAVAAAATDEDIDPRSLPILRELLPALSARLRLLIDLVAYFASQGSAPYVALADQCVTILSEVGEVVQSRETRAEKAAPRKKAGSGLSS
jgi:hypothetical protein